MALQESWHLRNRSRECSITQTPFTEDQPIITAIFPDPDSSGYVRKDFCESAWADRSPEDEPPFSYWRTKFQATQTNESQPVVPTPTGILRIYEHRKTGEIFIVKDPNIPLDEVEKFQLEVMELLSPQKSIVQEETPEPTTAEESDPKPAEGDLL